MAGISRFSTQLSTLSPEDFWQWATRHRNCIVRVSVPDSVLNDHEEFHWNLVVEGDDLWVVQLSMAKHLIGEILLSPKIASYVQCMPGEGDEHVCEWIADDGSGSQQIVAQFVMAHGFDDEKDEKQRPLLH